MADEPDSPRKFYTLKPRDFEAVNPPVGSGAPADPTRPAPGDGKIDVRDIFRSAALKPVAPAIPTAPAENEVHAMLKENLARANAAGLNDVPLRPRRKSRRTRDYWLALVAVNGFFVVSILLRPGVFIFAGAGMILFTVGLTWTMWVVMDDY